ncbi:DUF2066 domain-containing protein [Marinobacter zhejiangensis]|uniref:DUF2066 domain-containing protein n=1 Tax=Marinobacter zhejiangensis TaxID=488535 RepID=A0A1I4RBX5_9GAMM|nr:DUF2066 domain-containing protein [Marinobacter zhejiangensis]SFM49727.1 hypothetical protein SAMN04487963_2672 [Marinobacter zhejiangensis]
MPGIGRLIQPVMSTMYRFSLTVLLTLLGYAMPAAAVTVDGLYSVEVPVAGSAPSQLKGGYSEGLRQVFLRVSGSSDVLAQEGVDELLGNAESLLQSYQLLQGGNGTRLRMTFGAVGVNQALSSINAPVWGVNRPLTLAWVAVQDSSGRRLISPEQGGAGSQRWLQAFQSAAVGRGLPLAFPPAELAADRDLLSEVWGQFMEPVRAKSDTLGHDLLAAVRVSFDRNSWRASWTVEGRGLDTADRSVEATSPEQLAQRVVGAWADQLASRYAITAGDAGALPQVDIVLDNLESMPAYAAAKRALGALAPVASVGPIRVNKQQATLRVAFSGELSQLEEYIALDPRFVAVERGDGVTMMTATVETSESEASEPQDSENAEQPATEGSSAEESPAAMFSYQPLMVPADESEKAFEALYPVLHYRWQAQ